MPRKTDAAAVDAARMDRRTWLTGALALLAGCGGVDSGGTGTGDQSTLAVGPITGFGSIIVNAIRFDESAAVIVDDDGQTRQRGDLRLGMRAEVEASAIVAQGGIDTAVASTVRLRTELGGPLQAIDMQAGSMTVLGQRVDFTSSTVVDGGVASLHVGDVLWISGTLDRASGRYVATRIEPRSGVSSFKVRGTVSALDLTGRTLDIGALGIDWSGISLADPAAVLAPGRLVLARLAVSPSGGRWVALSLQPQDPAQPDRESAEIEGRISAFVSQRSFAIDGLPVDATNASFVGGTAGLALGTRVEVTGRIAGGVLLAQRVELEDDDDDDAEGIEIQGAIESVDAALQQFTVRSTLIAWDANTLFDSSRPSDIAVGRRVAVRGRLSADGQSVVASRIHVES
jgi:hypothetical protein